MELFFSFGAFGVIALLAAMSPGPDFLVVTKNSISHSRSIGAYTALGVGLGNVVHVSYSVLGIGLIIASSVVAFSVVKMAGAMYLVYLGVRLIAEKSEGSMTRFSGERGSKTRREAFREGFLTNVLNPKATLFFVSMFSQFLSPDLSIGIRALFGLEAVIIVAAWFFVLAFILTYPMVSNILKKVQDGLLKVMGAALLVLGVKLASAQQ